MASHIFRGKLMHARRDSVRHAFVYDVFMLLLDLDDLSTLDCSLPLFGYNRRSLVSVYDRDHLAHPEGGPDGVKGMVLAHLAAHDIRPGADSKVYMLTNPRILGYVFNPITVFYVYSAQGEMVGALAEVNNTHGEQHPYVLGPHNALPLKTREEHTLNMRRYGAQKVFYVSPWIPMDARYELSLTPVAEKMIVHVHEYRNDAEFFQARLWGGIQPLTPPALWSTLLRYPLMTLKVIGAIHWEGLKTHLKGAPFLRRRNAYRLNKEIVQKV